MIVWYRKLSFDIVIHIHKIADGCGIISNIAVSMNRMLDYTAGNSEVNHVHWFVIVHHGINQAAGKCISATDTVQNGKGK